MKKNHIKGLIMLLVIAFSAWQIYPTIKYYSSSEKVKNEYVSMKDPILKKIIKLGLDLKGGMHLILELQVDKLEKNVSIKDAMDRAMEIVRNRVDQFGVAEPIITKQGERWLVVELPGVKNPETAMELIGKTALLEFKMVEDKRKISEFLDKDGQLMKDKLPEDLEVLPGKEERQYLLKKQSELTGAYITNAQVKIGGQYGMPYVGMDFNSEGGKIFSKVTDLNVNKNLAIVLDGVVQSAPVIKSRIPDGHAIIEGNFTAEEAKNLAIVLKAGALPAPVKIIENVIIGPSMGADSIKKGVYASLIGLALVMLYIGFYYGFGGIVANFALIFNLFILLGVLAYLQATLTLPGIAGMILTLGMAVDANVLIFERMREEIRLGKTIRIVLDAGYEKAWTAILDSNVTTLIAALFLFQFGTGPVKGFAVTLTWGILISMFTAITATRYFFENYLDIMQKNTLDIGIKVPTIVLSKQQTVQK